MIAKTIVFINSAPAKLTMLPKLFIFLCKGRHSAGEKYKENELTLSHRHCLTHLYECFLGEAKVSKGIKKDV